ncbi:hypothetical protein [Reyranella sp. CPCC 100927]|uniref:hypothetical protein n=1 Tax=Reyranella sp. CPCC 100927 TaxID=2599616 RepID=UPI0011B3C620|nr:hypothetical protein [Reyranella sp. CPCC 100927]TWT09960.1 hypothetical protein FQU96_17855 [Reyranella sp. CPCC 100927]
MTGIDVWPSTKIALSRTALMAAGPFPDDPGKQALVAYSLGDGRELWRLPVVTPKPSVAISMGNDLAAIWNPGTSSVRVFAIPDGRPVAEVRSGLPGDDVSFVDDGAAIVLGDRHFRHMYRLADGTESIVPGFDNTKCIGPVGRSNIGVVTSRDNLLTAIVTTRDSLNLRNGRIEPVQSITQQILCSKGLLTLSPPPGASVSKIPVAVFAPNDDRLALVYDAVGADGRNGTLIEIRNTSQRSPSERSVGHDAGVVATFAMDGLVYHRLAWSLDGRTLAVVRSISAESQGPSNLTARVYAVP